MTAVLTAQLPCCRLLCPSPVRRSVTHPSCPETSHHVRVTDYFSEMVIEATNRSVKEVCYAPPQTHIHENACIQSTYTYTNTQLTLLSLSIPNCRMDSGMS